MFFSVKWFIIKRVEFDEYHSISIDSFAFSPCRRTVRCRKMFFFGYFYNITIKSTSNIDQARLWKLIYLPITSDAVPWMLMCNEKMTNIMGSIMMPLLINILRCTRLKHSIYLFAKKNKQNNRIWIVNKHMKTRAHTRPTRFELRIYWNEHNSSLRFILFIVIIFQFVGGCKLCLRLIYREHRRKVSNCNTIRELYASLSLSPINYFNFDDRHKFFLFHIFYCDWFSPRTAFLTLRSSPRIFII